MRSWARRSATCCGVREVGMRAHDSLLTSQRKDGIELHGAADGGGAAGERHEDGDGHDDREEHGLNGNLRIEDGAADLMGEQGSGRKSGKAADQSQQQGFGEENCGDDDVARAQGLHQSDFDAALVDGGGHGGGNRERGCEQGGESDQQHESCDAREHGAFVLRDLANLLGVRMRNHFLQLIGDRLHVGRAIPAVVNFGRHRLRIADGERVLRLGQGADVDAADGSGLAEDLLGDGERGDDLIVFGASGGEDAGDGIWRPSISSLSPACFESLAARRSPTRTFSESSFGQLHAAAESSIGLDGRAPSPHETFHQGWVMLLRW